MDTSKYLELFLSEAVDHLNKLDAKLVKLENSPGDEEIMKELMRHAHTLKGMASSMGYGQISNLTHSFEGMIENLKNDVAKGEISMLFGAIDELRRLVADVTSTKLSHKENPLVDQLGELEAQDIDTNAALIENPETLQEIKEIRVKTEKLDKIMEITSELMLNKMQLNTMLHINFEEFERILEKNSKLVEELQNQVLDMRLTPVAQVFNRFPRMIRDLSKRLNKNIAFVMEGEEIEVDREILDEIGEPIIHLLRNAVDHGIKKTGTVKLLAKREEDKIIIEVSDDGKGIDWQKLASKAGEVKLFDPRDLLYIGVSTADEVTDISGRGIGMGVVKSTLEKIGGRITVSSEKGKGTTFYLVLPVSVAIIKGLVVEISGGKYVVPVSSVEKLYNMSSLTVQKQADQDYTIIDDVEIPLVELRSAFNLVENVQSYIKEEMALDSGTVILAKNNDILYGFIVDGVLSQQDVVVKPLPAQIRNKMPFSTATILWDGKPAPIIDFNVLI